MAHENADEELTKHNHAQVKSSAQSTANVEAAAKAHAYKPTRQISGSVPGGKKHEM